MGSMPSSTDPAGSDDTGSTLACILHPTRSLATSSINQLSFKARARNQILRLHRELMSQAERFERVVQKLREQNKEDVVSLSSRVEYFEAQWSRLQQRMCELWLEVEGLKMQGHTYSSKSDASVQTPNCYTTCSSTQTRNILSSNAATPTCENTHSNLGIKDADELRQWRASFNHIPGTPAQKAEAIRSFCRIEQGKNFELMQSEKVLQKHNEFLAKEIKHLENDKAQQKSENRRLRERSINLSTEIKELEHDKARQESENDELQERNNDLSTEIAKEMSKREKLLKAVEKYQATSKSQNETKRIASTAGPSSSGRVSDGNNHAETQRHTSTTGPSPSRRVSDGNDHPNSPTSVLLAKRKREASELDSQQDEPLPASQRRRTGSSDPGWGPGERQGTMMAPRTASQEGFSFGFKRSLESSPLWSVPPTGAPLGPSSATGFNMFTTLCPMSGTHPPTYPIWPNVVPDGPRKESGYAETLPTCSPSPTSRSEFSFTNESMPKVSLPAPKKWEHSMLKRGN